MRTWWGCRGVVRVGRKRIQVALAGKWAVGHGWDWRRRCYGCDGVEGWREVDWEGRMKCGEGIDSELKRRIVLLTLERVCYSSSR